MNKYEKLIEYIINDQESQARELFHEIVVEKSRDIYENLLVDEQDMEETIGGNEVEDLVDEITADEEGISEEEFEVDAEMDGDDMDMDTDMDMGGEEGGELDLGAEEGGEEIEDRVMDLEDALDELRAEFDKLMGEVDGEASDEEAAFGDESESDEESKPFGESKKYAKEEEDEEEEVKEGQDELDKLREYVEKVAGVPNTDGADNKTSVVAKKNDMGGSAANIVNKSNDEQGGKVKAPATINSGNRNVPGAKAGSLEKAGKAKAAEEGGVNNKSIEPGSK